MEVEKKPKKVPGILLLKQVITRFGDMALSMRIKLFLILSMIIITMILGILVILTVTGTFTTGLRETQREIEEQLDHISQEVEDQYGELSIQSVELSKILSASIEKKLAEDGLTADSLKNHPELIEKIVGNEYEKCIFALLRSKSSGVFFILDGTVNPSLENAENSRAGLYIKNNEPNILSSSAPNMLMMRGFSSIGRQNSISLHSQWRMEFDVSEAPYFYRPMDAAKNKELTLSQMYYWTSSMTLPGTTEEIMICSAPLIDSKGNVFGVCGFEVSSMLFKLAHMPYNSVHKRIFCIFAPYTKDILNTTQAFFSGGYSIRKMTEKDQKLDVKYSNTFNIYSQGNKTLYKGLHKPVIMYPKGSAFSDEMWTVALMMPENDIAASVTRVNLQIGLMIGILLVIGLAASYFLSKRYIMPITRGIDIIKSDNYDETLKTNVYEIDDLIEFLYSRRGTGDQEKNDIKAPVEKSMKEKLPISLFDEFVKNTRTLSPAERAVFNLYVKGYTAKEITGILSLSINTVKTHNKRIYMKLNVTSREELLLYVNMLREAGLEME